MSTHLWLGGGGGGGFLFGTFVCCLVTFVAIIVVPDDTVSFNEPQSTSQAEPPAALPSQPEVIDAEPAQAATEPPPTTPTPTQPPEEQPADQGETTNSDDSEQPADSGETSETAAEPTATREPVDLTKLPLGNDYVSLSGANVGWVWSCSPPNSNAGGAEVLGPWISETDGTWDLTSKASVDGENT